MSKTVLQLRVHETPIDITALGTDELTTKKKKKKCKTTNYTRKMMINYRAGSAKRTN